MDRYLISNQTNLTIVDKLISLLDGSSVSNFTATFNG